jgi:hypothetical protein
MTDGRLYGLLAEFPEAESLLAAAHRARGKGYRQMDAFTPFPVEGLSEALGHRPTLLPWIVLGGAFSGGLAGYGLQLYLTLFHYPLNVGGRPLHSWPAFIPITFEITVLGGALAAVLGMLALNRLPTPYHPLFAAPSFERATQNGFFFCLEAADPLFDVTETRRFLEGLGPVGVIEVEA